MADQGIRQLWFDFVKFLLWEILGVGRPQLWYSFSVPFTMGATI
jgi:hypothetical protein